MPRTRSPRAEDPPPVLVQRATRAARLPRGADPVAWVRAAGARRAVTVRFSGWAESRRLNRQFRGKDKSTNVLAFPSAAPGELGDLVVCLPLVVREAREQGKTPLQHLAHLVVHGTLHLGGHDHEKPAAARRMEARERRVLAQLGFPDPYRPTAAPARAGGARRRKTP